MKIKDEILVGKYDIGYVSSTFTEHFKDEEVVDKKVGIFQTLTRSMNDREIESKLNPGLCNASDILAFIKNPPENTKDGNWNIFYTPSFVVYVYWGGSGWSVDAWLRVGSAWGDGERVFSPATVNLGNSDTSTLRHSVSLLSTLKNLRNKYPCTEAQSCISEIEKLIK